MAVGAGGVGATDGVGAAAEGVGGGAGGSAEMAAEATAGSSEGKRPARTADTGSDGCGWARCPAAGAAELATAGLRFAGADTGVGLATAAGVEATAGTDQTGGGVAACAAPRNHPAR